MVYTCVGSLCDDETNHFCSSISKGLKTGMYYLRTRPAANAIQFTVDQKAIMEAKQKQQQQPQPKSPQKNEEAAMACSLQNREACIMCSA